MERESVVKLKQFLTTSSQHITLKKTDVENVKMKWNKAGQDEDVGWWVNRGDGNCDGYDALASLDLRSGPHASGHWTTSASWGIGHFRHLVIWWLTFLLLFLFYLLLIGVGEIGGLFCFFRVLFWGDFGDLRMGSFSPSSLSLVLWETNKQRKEMNNGNFTGLPLVKWRVNVLGLLWNRARPD